ncbi:hypothetical protein HYPSUDRAFT_36895 [Hypholoma sublateritium FD-334 SS-4]|uniref:SGT1-domain-containing protein n=1 Tax=Hypholoma sublateritium (strain FD-334 SS-4) TaxID=945553 RepID=A0A0D2MQ00_HYPSF|nr:hypothetical protein HYPSUDRAFT_36895 [Hypholoma sublateritium FD-334 SS-4]
MDIFNRPHAIAEDTLHYTIYPPADLPDKAFLTSLAACITSVVEEKLRDFIWHRDSFEVKLVANPDDHTKWILEGRMRVGDCVDDEWLAVWLLREISSKWDVAISAYDSDGEFILIEAAEALPSWVKPTNSENRVWIYNSHLHLIHISHVSPSYRKRHHRKLPNAADEDGDENPVEDDETFIAAEDAVRLLRDSLIDTLAPPAVEEIVWKRIDEYPGAIKIHVHNARAYIPADIAKALSTNPSLVQKAIETFYTRDAIQLRAAHRMNRFPPNTSILTSVKMTRTAYAQLVGQKFFPPKVFGNWREPEDTKEWKWRDVGMKIAVGFEMLFQESKGRAYVRNTSSEGTDASVEANKDALRRTPEYQKYIENLQSSNYFQKEIKGSELWNTLENNAANTFIAIRRTDDAHRQSFASQVDEAVSHSKGEPPVYDEAEDSDGWLNIDADEFEQMLEASRAKPRESGGVDDMDVDESPEDRLASEQAKKLKDLASKVENFIDGEGDLEGARFEDEEFSDEPFSDEDDEESEAEPIPELSDPEAKKAAMDKLVPALEPTEYGKMPATYHSNSQRVALEVADADADVDMETINTSASPKAEKDPKARVTMRPPIIPRDRYDGVDSDDETDEEEIEDDESEEDRPQVVGEIEIDMNEEEEEFLEFSRQALGITDEQWSAIIKDRKDRGAFLPPSATTPSPFAKQFSDKEEKPAPRTHTPRIPEPGPRPNVNPDLDSFEAVMKALDETLLKSSKKTGFNKNPSPKPAASNKSKGKGKESFGGNVRIEEEDEKLEDDDSDIEAAMAAELKSALDDGDWDGEEPPDYNMIKNFLESYKSQQGLSGPVSSLAGRLQSEFKLPRDGF